MKSSLFFYHVHPQEALHFSRGSVDAQSMSLHSCMLLQTKINAIATNPSVSGDLLMLQ